MSNLLPPPKIFGRIGLGALLLATSVSASAELTFNAVVSFPTPNAGVYQFTTGKYDPKQIKREVYASGGGIAYDDGYYYAVRFENIMGITAVEQNSYDMSTWEPEDKYSGNIQNVATASTFDRDLGVAYGCFFNEDGQTFRLCSMNVPYFGATKIADLPKGWGACGFNKDGVLYAVDEDGLLMTVDTDNGALTPVGETGLVTEWITGGLVDKESNAMIYAIKSEAETALYSIDLATAKATKLYDLENLEQLNGFYIPEKEYPGGAPGMGYTKPSLSINNTATTGKLAFYAPAKTVDGSTGSGDITYHVYCNGKEVSTGTVEFKSARHSVDISVDKAGSYSFAVSFSNEAGEGPRQRADTKYIGTDIPKATTSVSLSYADGKVTVRWSGVSSGIHGGSIDRSNLVYRVTRYPDGTVVSADDLKTTSMTDEIATPDKRTTYWYTVEAVTGDLKSPATKSATFDLGPIEPPYETTFQSSGDFFGYTTLNPGTDTKKWEYQSEKCIRISTSAKPADSWLLLPPIAAKVGMGYEFTFAARSYGSNYTEEFEVLCGNAPTVEALTSPVIAKSTVNGSTYTEFTGTANADADGMLYIAIHATTPTNGGYFYINNIKIGKGVTDKSPAAVSDLTVTGDPSGAHKATITFTAPATTIGGAPLDAITRAELYRDGELIKTVTEGIEPGKTASITDDTNPTAGTHTYGVICYNIVGAGVEAKADGFIGFAAPAKVGEVKMTEPTPGHVVASWEAVKVDVDGRILGEGDVTYNVYKYLNGEVYPVATDVKGTTYEYDAFDGFEAFDSQRFVQTLIEAVTEGGVAAKVPSAQYAVGNPYKTPWRESFADCKIESIFANQIIKGTDVWVLSAQDSYTTPADNDGGMMYYEAYGRGACALLTGKIDLGEVVEPAFLFQVFCYASSDPNENLIEVEARSDGDYQKVFSSTIEALGNPGGWTKVTVPLSDFTGEVIQLRISAYNNSIGFTHLDDFQITSAAPYNLSIVNVEAPSTVAPDEEFNVKVEIDNNGTERAVGFKVNLLRDDELVESKGGNALDSEGKLNVKFNDCLGILAVGTHTYTVEIEYGPDLFADDNTRNFDITVRSNSLPVVTDLTATAGSEGIDLTWSAPAANTVVAEYTESFDAPSLAWATSVSGWTFLDKDGGTIGGIGSKQLPVSGRQSFFVVNNTHAALSTSTSFNAHSGTQYLCSMYALIGGKAVQSDDWAISPELTGEAQNISLWASSFLSDPGDLQYYETFQILYSTGSNEPEDFKLIAEYTNIPAQWMEYSAYLPEGARYFAIRCVSYDKYMLFVDDITFKAKNGATKQLVPDGYNVYCDGKRLNSDLVAATTFADKTSDATKTHSYVVTAHYTDGESLKSNEAIYDPSVSGITSAYKGNITISAIAGAIEVCGAADLAIEVYTTDGKVIVTTTGATRTVIPLASGFYIIKAGDTVAKVAVR